MILESLVAYYETLIARGVPGVPRSGWSTARVSYALELSREGELTGILPLKVPKLQGKKEVEVPQILTVPLQQAKGVGFKPNFLCDNALFLLGVDTRGKPERAVKAFEATRDLHLALLQDAEGPAARAVAAFFHQWDPASATAHPLLSDKLEDLAAGNLVFRLDGAYAHNDPELIRIWQEYYDRPEEGAVVLPCLVTGKPAPIARTHPIIRGIRDAPTTGSRLVGFNDTAYESYGKSQSYNAPVSNYAAFAYSTALNILLSDSEHRKVIGDATVVYWAQNGDSVYQDLFSQALDPDPALDDSLLDHIMASVARGGPVRTAFTVDADMPFFILGLAPNSARVSVRFFLQGTFGALLSNLAAHYQRLEIVRPKWDTFTYLPIDVLLQETVNKNAKNKAPMAAMAANTLSAILQGVNYPDILYQNTLLRIGAEHNVSRGQAAILKAHLLQDCRRQDNYPQLKEVATVELNEQCTYPPYVLGRLFAVLESIQEASADGKLNATIKDRFFSSAGTTPAPIFAQLFRLENSHMKKLHRDKPGLAFNFEKEKGALMAALTAPIPKHLDLEDQCTFRIGYYHQRQSRFVSNKEGI